MYSFYAYTEEWVKTVDRGGLFPVDQRTFVFFRAVELKTQQCLPTHLSGCSESTTEDVVQHIFDDTDVQFFWSMVVVDIEEEQDAFKLLRTIIQLWIAMRGFALTSAWMEAYKRTHKKSTKRSKGLRKGK